MSLFLGTGNARIDQPESIKTKYAEVSNKIEMPSSYNKRVAFPWTDLINKDINLPSTVLTPAFSSFNFGEAITFLKNALTNTQIVCDKITKTFNILSVFFASKDDLEEINKNRETRRASVMANIANNYKR